MSPHDSLMSYEKLHSISKGRPMCDAPCPQCGPDRRLQSNRTRRTLRVWNDGNGFCTYCCQRCGTSGFASDGNSAGATDKPRLTMAPKVVDTAKRTELVRWLHSISLPSDDTPVERYMTRRKCWLESSALRYLPARGEHGHAMLAIFGDGKIVTGIHLTRLAPDGAGKAGTDSDKIMIGPSQGQPIIIADRPSENLIVTEGIEDAASLALVTDWSAWAAGSAGRIPHLMQATKRFKKVFIASDDDFAGRRALQLSREIRHDVIWINCADLFGPPSDPNSVLRSYGEYGLKACIDCRHDIALDLMMMEVA